MLIFKINIFIVLLILNVIFVVLDNQNKHFFVDFKKRIMKRRDTTGLTNFNLNKENPFLKKAVEQIENNIVKKYKNTAGYGKKAVLQAIDPNTGEMLGHTTFIRQIEVDEEKFSKLYLSNFSAFFDLKPQAIRVFGYILNELVPNKDEFLFLIDEAQEFTKYKSSTSIRIGLTSLLKNEIIARGRADNLFFINPMIVFNGNRITFAKAYVKKQKRKEIGPNQIDLLDQIEEIESSK